MAAWKQALACLVLVLGAAVLWVHYDAGAVATLKGYGIDSPVIAALAPETATENRPAGASEAAAARPASLIVAEKVRTAKLNDRLKAIGSGMAVRTVAVTPTTSGTIETVPVRSGDRVTAGEVIAKLDSDAETIAAEKARLTLGDAEKKLKRYRELGRSAAVSTVDISDMESEVAADRLALKQAKYELGKRTIRAPYDGTIGIVDVNIGDYVTNATKIATVDDRSTILVDFQVPERFLGQIKLGTPVSAISSAFPGKTFDGSVSAIDNRIDPDSRTLRVRAQLPNESDLLRAGMSFEVTLLFAGDVYASVDPLAVQWDSSGAYVWKIVDGKAKRVDVKVIQRNAQRVLVAGATLGLGDHVATSGVQMLRPGSDVEFANGGDGSDAAPLDEESDADDPTEKAVAAPAADMPAKGADDAAL